MLGKQIISPFSRGDRPALLDETGLFPLNPSILWFNQRTEKMVDTSVGYRSDKIDPCWSVCPTCQHSQHLQTLLRSLLPATTWREATEGVRRGGHLLPTKTYEASILRLDIADFTDLMDNHPLDDVLADLNTYFSRLTPVVHGHSGDVHKFLGDGFLSIFSSADGAVAAGCALQQAAAAFNRRQVAKDGIVFPTRLAIDTGQVALTSLGAPDRQDQTVMGMPVNLAERLQAQATPGRVWLSQATFERLSDPSGYHCLGPIEVKGRQEPLVVYEKL